MHNVCSPPYSGMFRAAAKGGFGDQADVASNLGKLLFPTRSELRDVVKRVLSVTGRL